MDLVEIRSGNLACLVGEGFVVSSRLTVERQRQQLRPVYELALRMRAIELVFAWVAIPDSIAPTAKLRAALEDRDLARAMTPGELAICHRERAAARAAYGDAIRWRIEAMWPLAWIFGCEPAPALDGVPLDDRLFRRITLELLPPLAVPLARWAAGARVRPTADVVALEDRFYCCHDAVQRAQLGDATVPAGFHPVVHGGVIQERRHALTWALSPGIAWDDTDLR